MAKGACRCSPCSCQGTGTPSPSLPASSPPASHSQGFPSALRQRHIIINLLLKQPLHSSHIHKVFCQPWGQRHFYYKSSYAASSPSALFPVGSLLALTTETYNYQPSSSASSPPSTLSQGSPPALGKKHIIINLPL